MSDMTSPNTSPETGGSTSRSAGRSTGAVLVLLASLASGQALAGCSVSSSGVAFGAYDPFATQHLQSAGTITVVCDAATAYTIALDAGAGSYDLRTLVSGVHRLGYNLYVDAARTIVWGDGTGGTSTVSGTGDSASHTVYGRIPAQQNVHVGSYADTVLITVTF